MTSFTVSQAGPFFNGGQPLSYDNYETAFGAAFAVVEDFIAPTFVGVAGEPVPFLVIVPQGRGVTEIIFIPGVDVPEVAKGVNV